MRTFAIFIALLLAASVAFGATCSPVLNPWGAYLGEVNPAYDLTGCLQATAGALTVNPASGDWSTAYIAWHIEPTANGYLYEYTWWAASKDLSHLILGVSENCADSNCIWNFTGAGMDFGWWGPNQQGESNPGLPGMMWGIKVSPNSQSTSLTFSFESDRVPVWQNFYAKDGNAGPVYAYNAGFGSNAGNFVAAPDSVMTGVPEPGFYGLLSLGLAGLYFAVRRRMAQ